VTRSVDAARALGARWEQRFVAMGLALGRIISPHQLRGMAGEAAVALGPDSRWLLPDMTLWDAGGEHHEIKHKNPMAPNKWRDFPAYGLERYRLEHLWRFARVVAPTRVYYTIHDWSLAGAESGDDDVPNDIAHWVTADVLDLAVRVDDTLTVRSWVNGKMEPHVRTLAWNTTRFHGLKELWAGAPIREAS
jgi:hypothetical protein